MKVFVCIVLCISFLPCSGQETKVLLQTDSLGEIIVGSLEELIESVKKGERIRVGWSLDFDGDGVPNVEHMVEASFLTILDGHVFNQIEPIYAQAPNAERPQVEIGNNTMKWTAVIGSNGNLMSKFLFDDVENVQDQTYKKQIESLTQVTEQIVSTIWIKN